MEIEVSLKNAVNDIGMVEGAGRCVGCLSVLLRGDCCQLIVSPRLLGKKRLNRIHSCNARDHGFLASR